MSKKITALFILVFQILFLTGMVAYHQAKLAGADRILLKTVPYDPRSIFRGPYVDLTYEISSLPSTLLKDIKAADIKSGDELFVGLAKNGDYWAATGIYKVRPSIGGVFLRARVSEYWRYYSGNDNERERKINLKYGIESFFLNEERAKEVEKVSTRQHGQWEQTQQAKDKRIQELDAEAYRIRKAGISEWWVRLLDKEIEVWLAQGLISQEQKNIMHDKYARAMDLIEKVEKEVSAGNLPGQKPLIVEVAVDRSSNGYPVKLFLDGKEYK
ncbi:MAG: GDYXXLXY domain-containing protein [Candidatus Omnitrophota bacterium]